MLGHGAKFGHKKEQAIAALLLHRNVEAAARAVGISANTLLRWTKDSEFEAAYREARRAAFCQSIARLQEASGAAVTTVLKIMLDSKVSAGTRLRAAEVVLSQGAKAAEIEDIEARVAELERPAGSAQRFRASVPLFSRSFEHHGHARPGYNAGGDIRRAPTTRRAQATIADNSGGIRRRAGRVDVWQGGIETAANFA